MNELERAFEIAKRDVDELMRNYVEPQLTTDQQSQVCIELGLDASTIVIDSMHISAQGHLVSYETFVVVDDPVNTLGFLDE